MPSLTISRLHSINYGFFKVEAIFYTKKKKKKKKKLLNAMISDFEVFGLNGDECAVLC